MRKVVKSLINKGKIGYNIKLYLSNGDVLNFEDVDCDKASVRRLLARLQGAEVDEEQVWYFIQDHLVREYSVRR